MIKKDYLSEVEALYVQRQALVEASPPRVFVVWADVGHDVHGFVAVLESEEERANDVLITFRPVCDLVILTSYMQKEKSPHGWVIDHRTKSPEDLVRLIVDASKWKDEEAICRDAPSVF